MQKPKHRNEKNLYSPARGRRLNRDKKTTSPPSRDWSLPAVARCDCHQQAETVVPILNIGTLSHQAHQAHQALGYDPKKYSAR